MKWLALLLCTEMCSGAEITSLIADYKHPSNLVRPTCTESCSLYGENVTCDAQSLKNLGDARFKAYRRILSGRPCVTETAISSGSAPEFNPSTGYCFGILMEGSSIAPDCEAMSPVNTRRKYCACKHETTQTCPPGAKLIDEDMCIRVLDHSKTPHHFNDAALLCNAERMLLISFRDDKDFEKKAPLLRAEVGPGEPFLILSTAESGGILTGRGEGELKDPSNFETGTAGGYTTAKRFYVTANDKIGVVAGPIALVTGSKKVICIAPSRIILTENDGFASYSSMSREGEVLNVEAIFVIVKEARFNINACGLSCLRRSGECRGFNWDPDNTDTCTLLRTNAAIDALWKVNQPMFVPGNSNSSIHWGVIGDEKNFISI